TAAEIQALADAFQRRGLDTIIVPAAGDPFFSPASLRGTLETLPPDVRALVDRGQLAYVWQTVDEQPSLVVGGRVAGSGPGVWFIHTESAIDETLAQLRFALIVGTILLAIVALVVARVVARGVLAPVDEAARTAARIAGGELDARVPVTSNDEFGVWAAQFNE